MTKEILENSYIEALLRAALLFGDLHCEKPAREITIATYWVDDGKKHISRRCGMTVLDQNEEEAIRTQENNDSRFGMPTVF